ncbi:glycosyltransferase family 76 protein [Baudoinia panamericana UAMH 10762]|uniref:GPI mannosyltransferase 2 n=1 Tax=Baudoinia panamericana (strain UAMH 10762) TaxID=717646 RepID=M2NH58_BAUPA|nr:glycosyltransferase family 76 protein [Baudoinia panamericana UAMH 10762]EMC98360.1 glycosyltransferase family 76 protein [Baudoinia panamericana UAMH 10762]
MNVLKTYFSPTRISQPATLKGKAARPIQQTSIQRLLRIFAAWKAVLLIVALLSPGVGYDTSTRILFDQHAKNHHLSWVSSAIEYIVLRLTRWDAIYFASNASRGYVREQDWAFSWLLSKCTSFFAGALLWPLPVSSIVKHAIAGICISHLSHALAVIVLYQLVYTITPSPSDQRKRQVAFTTACLHILSPAGIFLSAPYGESTFALFNFLGLLCYAIAVDARFSNYADAYQIDACWTLGAGIFFGLASMIRSNGLLSGLIFLWDAVLSLPNLPQLLRIRDLEQLTRLLSTLTAGLILASCFAFPQYLAYTQYCTNTNAPRPWCTATPPSIYTFVQSHYWNVGLFRYWTLPNLPLFALAFPMGWIMVETTFPCLLQSHHVNRVLNGSTQADQKPQPYPPTPQTRREKVLQHLLPRFALPQLLLVALAATSFHVQILNRISSGYPIWYLALAIEMCVPAWGSGDEGVDGKRQALFRLFGNYDRIPSARPEWVVRGMMVYAVVQAGLFASFLPPA